MPLFREVLSSVIIGHLFSYVLTHSKQLANGKYTSRNTQEPAEIIISSGHVVYAKWDRVAGCNLDAKRTDCTLVEKSIRSLGPCTLLWQLPFVLFHSYQSIDYRMQLKYLVFRWAELLRCSLPSNRGISERFHLGKTMKYRGVCKEKCLSGLVPTHV